MAHGNLGTLNVKFKVLESVSLNYRRERVVFATDPTLGRWNAGDAKVVWGAQCGEAKKGSKSSSWETLEAVLTGPNSPTQRFPPISSTNSFS